jgi:hypothetical protein
VDTSRERDQSIERLLRQSLKTPQGGVTDSCLDAETVAAWTDGGLSGAALEMAQSHVADCARCQSLVGAMARTNAAVSQPETERATRRWLGWLVPLTAAAAAVALWIAVPREATPPLPRAAEVQTPAPNPTAQEPAFRDKQLEAPLEKKEEQAPKAAARNERPTAAPELRRDTGQLEADSLQQRQAASPPAAAPQAAPAEEAPASAQASADKARTTAPTQASAGLARSANAFAQMCAPGWSAVPTDIAAQLTAGAAPSTSVCWLVGHGGVVIVSIDEGRNWRRLAFPETTDLSAVQATDARTASVSTADGRTFSTSDGGITWNRP